MGVPRGTATCPRAFWALPYIRVLWLGVVQFIVLTRGFVDKFPHIG
jgi:hypothetical protein